MSNRLVATAPTVYGIETARTQLLYLNLILLQQHLPFTVLKLPFSASTALTSSTLQQHLPFTVLKPLLVYSFFSSINKVATVLTVYGIETLDNSHHKLF